MQESLHSKQEVIWCIARARCMAGATRMIRTSRGLDQAQLFRGWGDWREVFPPSTATQRYMAAHVQHNDGGQSHNSCNCESTLPAHLKSL